MDEISYSDFMNKELILFSMADNVRSIPCVADGLKPGQRKVMGVLQTEAEKRNQGRCSRVLSFNSIFLCPTTQVAQLVGYISEHAAYHHGEQSLTMMIINRAQDYVGSNNLNLLLMASMGRATRAVKTMPQRVTSSPSRPPSRVQFSTQRTTHYLTT
jgi:DNA topoisomerase-2